MTTKDLAASEAERLFLETVMSLLSISKIEIRMNALPHQMVDLVDAKVSQFALSHRDAA